MPGATRRAPRAGGRSDDASNSKSTRPRKRKAAGTIRRCIECEIAADRENEKEACGATAARSILPKRRGSVTQSLKRRAADFLRWHTVQPLENPARELLFQGIVQRDLARFGVVDDFYPIGGAASYALLYLLIRLLRENAVATIVELGSGESTRLIDRVKAPGTRHVCYENDAAWFERTAPRLRACDYRLRPLERFRLDGAEYDWYGK